MTGGSVKAVIERGDPRRDKFYLRVTDGSRLVRKIAQLAVR